MKKFECVIFTGIIMTLIVSSTQTVIAADDSSWHEDIRYYIVDPDINVRFEVYLQSVVRDTQGQLLSVSESTDGWVILSAFSDGVRIPDLVDIAFDNNLITEKKVVTIDNVKYEKIQFQTERIIDQKFISKSNPEQNWNGQGNTGMASGSVYNICSTYSDVRDEAGNYKGDYGHQCVPVFGAKTPLIPVTENHVITNQWTILRSMN